MDDNPQNLELLQAYLEDLGCPVRTARDGQECLREVETAQPDLILLDIMMPRMSGFQACERLKSDPATRDIPIIMVTALNEKSDIEKALVDSGANDFLAKPVNKTELLTRAKSLLSFRLLKQERDRLLDRLRTMGQLPPPSPSSPSPSNPPSARERWDSHRPGTDGGAGRQ